MAGYSPLSGPEKDVATPRLSKDDDEDEPLVGWAISPTLRRSWLRAHWQSIAVHGLLASVNVLIATAFVAGLWTNNDPQHAPSE